LPGFRHELRQIGGQELDVLSGPVFEQECESAGRADSGDRGWREAECDPFRQRAELAVQSRLDGLPPFLALGAIQPLYQSDPAKTAITGARETEQTETRYRGVGLDAGGLGEHAFDAVQDGVGSLKRR